MKAICKLPGEDAPRLVEKPIPKLGPDDVLVKVAYAGICKTDLKVAKGELPCKSGGVILGHEFSGTVVDCGKAINPNVIIGRNISANPMLDNISDRMLGKDIDGCFAEYVSVPLSNIVDMDHDDMKLNAYMEPVAAALGALSPNLNLSGSNGVIAGDPNDRIANLILMCYECEYQYFHPKEKADSKLKIIRPEELLIKTDLGNPKYDYIIECCPTIAGNLLKCLNKKGTLILKSRGYCKLSDIIVNDIVMRELKIVGAKYCESFLYARDFIIRFCDRLKHMIAESDFKLENFEDAFIEASKPNAKKVMFKCAQ
jgi:threonine dehydrogenase-like Zn-dependent dehydrogenase